jgi:hypothetical protein
MFSPPRPHHAREPLPSYRFLVASSCTHVDDYLPTGCMSRINLAPRQPASQYFILFFGGPHQPDASKALDPPTYGLLGMYTTSVCLTTSTTDYFASSVSVPCCNNATKVCWISHIAAPTPRAQQHAARYLLFMFRYHRRRKLLLPIYSSPWLVISPLDY